MLHRWHTGRLRKRDTVEGEGRGEAISYDSEKAWPSINNSILCGEVPTECVHDLVFWQMFWQFCQKKEKKDVYITLYQLGQCILFTVVFTPFPPCSHHGSVWLLPVISLLLTNTVFPVRALPIYMIGEVSWEPKWRRARWASQYLIPQCLLYVSLM
jgi:hypothetical protein